MHAHLVRPCDHYERKSSSALLQQLRSPPRKSLGGHAQLRKGLPTSQRRERSMGSKRVALAQSKNRRRALHSTTCGREREKIYLSRLADQLRRAKHWLFEFLRDSKEMKALDILSRRRKVANKWEIAVGTPVNSTLVAVARFTAASTEQAQ